MMTEPASMTLNAIYGWGDEPAEGDSYPLVRRVNAALRKPLAELDEEDIRLLVGQNYCLVHVMPMAVDILEHDPLLDVTFYPGDLLAACLKVETTFWSSAPDLRSRLEAVVIRLITDRRGELDALAVGDIPDEIKNFLNSYAS